MRNANLTDDQEKRLMLLQVVLQETTATGRVAVERYLDAHPDDKFFTRVGVMSGRDLRLSIDANLVGWPEEIK